AHRCTLFNCTLSGNVSNRAGGGAYDSTLYNCTVTGNWAEWGCGASGTLYNCTVTGNGGGGVITLYDCWDGTYSPSTVYNSIVYNNSGGNYDTNTVLNHCLTIPLPTNGVGNIAGDPRFVNAAAGDFRLLPDSPGIDAGTNLAHVLTTDSIGLPRPLDGNNDGVARFDIGAYEHNPYRFTPSLRATTDGFVFTVRGEPGKSVRIERSRDLIHWEFAGEVPIPASGQTLVDPAAITEPFLFYRAMRMP
ncbi:MAG TPA: choice-of-anchor Q domain-containing protein, partial [Verrucomicrobiae bacterium]